MDFKYLSDGLAVAPQITLDEIKALADRGFRSIIVNRPDGEVADQPGFAEVEAAAKRAGLRAAYLPVTPDRISDGDAAKFAAALRELPGPVLAYCRSGARSATLWSRAMAAERPVADILGATRSGRDDMAGAARP